MSAIHETTHRPLRPPLGQEHLAQDLLAHPADVLTHPTMTMAEKRQILSSWASDARAVDSDPTLRRLPVGALVPIADILAALRALPEESGSAQPAAGPPDDPAAARRHPAPRRKVPAFVGWHRRRKRGDDDWPGGGAPALALHPAPGLSG